MVLFLTIDCSARNDSPTLDFPNPKSVILSQFVLAKFRGINYLSSQYPAD